MHRDAVDLHLFVHLVGDDRDIVGRTVPVPVRDDIEQSLTTLVANRPGHTFGPINTVVHGVRCEDLPACAMVTAAGTP